MTCLPRKSRLSCIVAVILCVSVVVFFSALLIHTHTVGSGAGHAAHCQVCSLAHTIAFTVSIATLAIALHMVALLRAGAPNRGSPRIAAVHTTRPPPAL